jgi:hypothetical protein
VHWSTRAGQSRGVAGEASSSAYRGAALRARGLYVRSPIYRRFRGERSFLRIFFFGEKLPTELNDSSGVERAEKRDEVTGEPSRPWGAASLAVVSVHVLPGAVRLHHEELCLSLVCGVCTVALPCRIDCALKGKGVRWGSGQQL